MLGPSRPLSPCLHYRRQYTNTLSVLHWASGIILSGGYLLLAYWITAIARGAVAYARAAHLLTHPLVKVLFALGLVAFVYHFCNGIRHLVWDAGFGLERRDERRSARIVGLATILIGALLVILVCLGGGGVR